MATLGFSTKWPQHMGGGDTNFPAKIWKGLESNSLASIDSFAKTLTGCNNDRLGFEKDVDFFDVIINSGLEGKTWLDVVPKLHTIRYDPHNRWKPGMKIHMVVFNRTKNRFQFAPVLEVKSVQYFQIIQFNYLTNQDSPTVYIGDKKEDVMPFYFNDPESSYGIDDMEKLAKNDGFDSVKQFFQWFNKDTKPDTKIIHWTNLKY